MRNDLSMLRKFCGWLGKPNLVKPLDYYLPGVDPERLKVSTVAKTKSWSANRVDLEAKLKEAFEHDHTMGMRSVGTRGRQRVKQRSCSSRNAA
jgi:hypothetical protein